MSGAREVVPSQQYLSVMNHPPGNAGGSLVGVGGASGLQDGAQFQAWGRQPENNSSRNHPMMQTYMKKELVEYAGEPTTHQSAPPQEQNAPSSSYAQVFSTQELGGGQYIVLRLPTATAPTPIPIRPQPPVVQIPVSSNVVQIPVPLRELHTRLETKRQTVIGLARNDREVIEMLNRVQEGT